MAKHDLGPFLTSPCTLMALERSKQWPLWRSLWLAGYRIRTPPGNRFVRHITPYYMAKHDQRLAEVPNPTGYMWDEVHPPNGPPGWDPQRYWQWEDARLLLTFIPSRFKSGPERAVVLMYRPFNLPAPSATPLGLRPQNLQNLLSYCCGAAHATACPIGERLYLSGHSLNI